MKLWSVCKGVAFASLFAAVFLTPLSSCGGPDPLAYERALKAALAKEAEVKSLAIVSPCANATQCGLLALRNTYVNCDGPNYVPYSLLSSSASTVKSAAQQHTDLAQEALQLEPARGFACAAVGYPEPLLVCRANTCQLAQ